MKLLDKSEVIDYINLDSKIRNISEDILNLLKIYGYFTDNVYYSGSYMSTNTLDIYYRMGADDEDDGLAIPIPVDELETKPKLTEYLRSITKQKQDYVWSYTDEDTKEKLQVSYEGMKHVAIKTGDNHLITQVKRMENQYGVHNLNRNNNGILGEGV